MSKQLVPEQLTQLAHRIKSNLINMDKDISTSRACHLSASKFLATCYNIEFLSFKHAPPHQHSSWTTTSKRQHTFHQRSLHTNRTSRDSSEQPFLRLHQSSFNEQHHQQHINSSQTEARTSIQQHQFLSRLDPSKEFSEYLTSFYAFIVR